jgi:hypothetical protein
MASRHIMAHLGRSQPPAKRAPKAKPAKGTGARPQKANK